MDEALATAYRVLERTPLVDGHNDLPWVVRERAGGDVAGYDLRAPTAGHTDLERLGRGRVRGQFWVAYVPCEEAGEAALRYGLEQADLLRRMVHRYPEALGWATSADELEAVAGQGRIASLMGVEGGHVLQDSLDVLRAFHALGARYLTLTHNCNTSWADAATDERRSGGLSPFGREVVRELNRLGMMVDLSHVSPETMRHALDASEAPVVFTHSSARALTDHPRNVPDDVLEGVGRNGGLVMVTFVPRFVSEGVRTWEGPVEDGPRATLADVADHVEHVRRVAGMEHVGLGADFDGTPMVTQGLEDVSTYPALFAELVRRGWRDDELEALAGRNLLRVMRAVEAVGERGVAGMVGMAGVAGVAVERNPGGTDMDRRPRADDYAEFYAGYVAAVPDGDIVETLERLGAELTALLRGVPPELEEHRYAEGKWSVREVVGHMIDTERVLTLRALHFARGAPTELPSFDENAWAVASNAGERGLPDLVDELEAVRRSTVRLFRSFAPAMMEARGVASARPVTVRALAWMTAGHAEHHRRLLEERYLAGEAVET